MDKDEVLSEKFKSKNLEEVGEDVLDEEIVNIVKYMNEYDGIKTLMSCAGHSEENVTAYVSFMVKDFESLTNLIDDIDLLNHQERSKDGTLAGRVEIKVGGTDYYRERFDTNIIFYLLVESDVKDKQRKLLSIVEKQLEE